MKTKLLIYKCNEYSSKEVYEHINSFIIDKKVIDIKFCVSLENIDGAGYYNFLIMYEEKT